MRFAAATAVAGLAAVAAAHGGDDHGHGPEQYGWPHGGNGTAPSYVTSVVTAYTTYCPSATEITHGASTYTVTEPTTLTITNCPCTVTYPVSSSTVSASSAPPVYSSSTPVAPTTPAPYTSSSPAAPYPTYPAGNGTTVAPTGSYSASSTSASESAPVSFTGAAVAQAVPAGLLAVLGLVAAL